MPAELTVREQADLSLRPTLLGLPDVPAEGEKELLTRLVAKHNREAQPLALLDKYYEGEQRLRHIGLAVPPELRIFEAVVNVPRVAVDEVVKRQELRGFYQRGSGVVVDSAARDAADYNNLDSQSILLQTDQRLFGRGFVSLSTNPDDRKHPRITIESPQNFTVGVDRYRRMLKCAARPYKDELSGMHQATLYTPNATSHWKIEAGKGWVLDSSMGDRDEHNLGRLPIVMFLNRQRSGRFEGSSEMKDVIGKTDGIARILTNMQVGVEAHGLPHWWVVGAQKKDFVDADNNPLPQWEAYMTVIKSAANSEAKFGQFSASDMRNFYDTVNEMLTWCAFELGLPVTYIRNTANPAAEGAINASEIRLIRNVELKNRFDGDAWVWVMDLESRFRTGSWPEPNRIRADYFSPATPTFAQRADALSKLRAGKDISRRGMWTELGWSEDRQDQEADWLKREREEDASDPVATALLKSLNPRTAGQSPVGQPPAQQPVSTEAAADAGPA